MLPGLIATQQWPLMTAFKILPCLALLRPKETPTHQQSFHQLVQPTQLYRDPVERLIPHQRQWRFPVSPVSYPVVHHEARSDGQTPNPSSGGLRKTIEADAVLSVYGAFPAWQSFYSVTENFETIQLESSGSAMVRTKSGSHPKGSSALTSGAPDIYKGFRHTMNTYIYQV